MRGDDAVEADASAEGAAPCRGNMNAKATIQRQIRRAKVKKRLRPLQVRPFVTGLVAAILGTFTFITLLPAITLELAGLPEPELPAWNQGIRILDGNDRPVCTIYGERDQEPVHLAQISPHLQHAIVAAEDHDFYTHDGINLFSIARAFIVDISAGHPRQGGSTISQQLVKNLYFEGKKRNLLDKIAEALMAIEMERRYSKQQILEAYLNCVYFGDGVYGAERAAQQYFGKHASQLDIAQSAFLAGLVTAPSQLSQERYRQRAIARQHLILNSMEELHLASAASIAHARKEQLTFHPISNSARNYRYYTSELLSLLRKDFGEDHLYDRGYKVYSYLDPQAQLLAEKTLAAGIRRAPAGINQGALVSISVPTGGIIAMVGGAGSYDRNQWNRALSPHTAGSAFKPFVYLAGLQRGVLAPDTVLIDEPVEIQQPGCPVYRPRNFDGTYLGPITIRKALALSRNTCAVKVAQQVGPEHIVDTARAAGISSRLDANLSLALGSSAVSPLEMANAYATLARGGEYVEPAMVRRIEDAQGHVLRQYSQKRQRVFEQEPVAELVDALQDVVEKGTGTRAKLFDRPVAGKTGTSDAAKDIWFIGFTPDTVTSVWGGNDSNHAVAGHVTGGTVMASIWQQYMRSYYRIHNTPPGAFTPPEHPLMDEPEPIHFLPTPADIFSRLFGPLVGGQPTVREYRWNAGRQKPEASAPDADWDDDDGGPDPRPRRGARKGLLRRFMDWLDF
jgi:penicillin-binding protein 1A